MNSLVINDLERLEKWIEFEISVRHLDCKNQELYVVGGIWLQLNSLFHSLKTEAKDAECRLPRNLTVEGLNIWMEKTYLWKENIKDIFEKCFSQPPIPEELYLETLLYWLSIYKEGGYSRETLITLFEKEGYAGIIEYWKDIFGGLMHLVRKKIERIQEKLSNPTLEACSEFYADYCDRMCDKPSYKVFYKDLIDALKTIRKKDDYRMRLSAELESVEKEVAKSPYAEAWKDFFKKDKDLDNYCEDEPVIGRFLYRHPKVNESEDLRVHLKKWIMLKNESLACERSSTKSLESPLSSKTKMAADEQEPSDMSILKREIRCDSEKRGSADIPGW